jgi:hypothetical protein
MPSSMNGYHAAKLHGHGPHKGFKGDIICRAKKFTSRFVLSSILSRSAEPLPPLKHYEPQRSVRARRTVLTPLTAT